MDLSLNDGYPIGPLIPILTYNSVILQAHSQVQTVSMNPCVWIQTVEIPQDSSLIHERSHPSGTSGLIFILMDLGHSINLFTYFVFLSGILIFHFLCFCLSLYLILLFSSIYSVPHGRFTRSVIMTEGINQAHWYIRPEQPYSVISASNQNDTPLQAQTHINLSFISWNVLRLSHPHFTNRIYSLQSIIPDRLISIALI